MVDMSSRGGPNDRFRALVGWRDGTDEQDPARGLVDDDLHRIADSPAANADEVARVQVSNQKLVRELAPKIADAVRNAALHAAGKATTDAAARADTADHDRADSGQSQQADGNEFALAEPSAAQQTARMEVRVSLAEDAVLLNWPRAIEPGGVVLYRVVQADAPEDGILRHLPLPDRSTGPVHVTQSTEFRDPTPPRAAFRRYWVWANRGANEAAARLAQPELWADGLITFPVQDARIMERDGQVVGMWEALPGTVRAEVHRHAPGEPYSPRNVLRAPDSDDRQLQGFVDRSVDPGEEYEYSVYSQTVVDEVTHQSQAVSRTVRIPARPTRVTDLEVSRRTGSDQTEFDVQWTRPPVGSVAIYLSEAEPDPGLALEMMEAERLASTPLKPSARLDRPSVQVGQHTRIERVPWPEGWARAYFTPVTSSGSYVQVGDSKQFVRTGAMSGAALRERVDSQTIVFDWPEGAADVTAYVTAPGQVPVLGPTTVSEASITKSDYDHQGGLLLDLAGRPKDVHLVPRAFQAGKITYGGIQTVPYPGLARVGYTIHQPTRQQGFMRKVTVPDGAPVVQVRIDLALPEPLMIRLVRNSDRLPLYDRDGELLLSETRSLQPHQEVTVGRLDPAVKGYVRLFCRTQSNAVPVAVRDPDVGTLWRQ